MRLRPRSDWRWSHGFSDWRWNSLFGCWSHPGYGDHAYWCLGDRMFHEAYGAERGDVVYHGSYVEDWHGGIQTASFTEAMKWLHEANGTDKWAWSK